jgi:hypothetical protein
MKNSVFIACHEAISTSKLAGGSKLNAGLIWRNAAYRCSFSTFRFGLKERTITGGAYEG